MNETLQIAQLTDCHVSAAPGTLYRGQDPVKGLQRVVDHVSAMQPDILLATGDLSEDGSEGSYEILANMLAQPGVPVLALPGNHDEPAVLEQYFPGSPVDGISVTNHGDWQVIRLNSCMPGLVHGQLDQGALDQLGEVLDRDEGRPRLVALHHQPLSVGSPWIDMYRLMDAGPFLDLIEGTTDIRVVVWGHIHQPFEAESNGTLMLGGPSSVANSLPGTKCFTPDARGPAYRWLELAPNGSVKRRVMWL